MSGGDVTHSSHSTVPATTRLTASTASGHPPECSLSTAAGRRQATMQAKAGQTRTRLRSRWGAAGGPRRALRIGGPAPPSPTVRPATNSPGATRASTMNWSASAQSKRRAAGPRGGDEDQNHKRRGEDSQKLPGAGPPYVPRSQRRR